MNTKTKSTTTQKTEDQEFLLSHLNWDRLKNRIKEEIRSREDAVPVVSAYRWWARRPGQLFAAILDVAGTVRVADPFGGGGTVAVEAARRKLPVYVQELYPWPVFGLATALTPIPPEALDEAARWLLDILEPLRRPYILPDGRELTHILRARVGRCPECAGDVVLFQDPMISLASRQTNEHRAYFGCPVCAQVWLEPRDSQPRYCPHCNSSLRILVGKGRFRCPLCGHSAPRTAFLAGPLRWRAVLVQEVIRVNGQRRIAIRPVDATDPVEVCKASDVFPQLREPIPPGLETNRLLKTGFRVWGDLYTDRQAAILMEGIRALVNLEHACRNHLALAVLGAAEMPAFLTRWERYHPKAVEALAHHRYADTLLAVEVNLLSPTGRGTLPRRLEAMRRVADWVHREIGANQRVHLLWDPSNRLNLASGIYLALGSSVRMALRDGAVDLVLTDPPYHDDIQYGELARLFHFWLRLYLELPPADEKEEATANYTRGRNTDGYTEILARCFQECRRVLRPGGRLVLTFRNRKLAAWRALCAALDWAGFRVHALGVVQTDESRDPTRRGRRSMQCDLILECMGCETSAPNPPFFRPGSTAEQNALIAMGLALAEALRESKTERLRELYIKWNTELGFNAGDWIR